MKVYEIIVKTYDECGCEVETELHTNYNKAVEKFMNILNLHKEYCDWIQDAFKDGEPSYESYFYDTNIDNIPNTYVRPIYWTLQEKEDAIFMIDMILKEKEIQE